ncbi:putative ABC transport system permease protein [Rhodopseudomonas rhenobacensis]|uniref:Putative ABC transport system permease protein n=1 Tax=Rhodopseudomonas rhenobacensis TaxID=87461 RepID=A0A7W8DY24_9BRAD|nr:putative ABC transport system permease protein [Rhodopseudomonas rhenobacensis]
MKRALWILAVLLSHWRRHPMQLATLLVGLISATALWSGVQALNQQARISYDRAASALGGARTATLVGSNGESLPQQIFVELRRAGWPVSPMLEGRIQIGGRSLRLLGVEPLSLPIEASAAPAIGTSGLQGFLSPPGQTLIAPDTLAELKAAAGDTPLTNTGLTLPPLTPQNESVPGLLVVDIGVAQRLLNMPEKISQLLLGQRDLGPRAPLASIAGGETLRLVEPDAETDLERLTDSFHLNLTAFGLLSFLVGLFIVNSAIGLAFEQRRPMLRTLRACGVSALQLNSVLIVELVGLALLAGLIGLVCGYFIAATLLPDVAASLRGLYGAQIPGELTLRPQWWAAGLAISVIGALGAASASLLKAIRLPVLAAAQPYAWQQAQQTALIVQGALALIVFAGGVGCLLLGDSLVAGFAVLAAILLGAALALPAVLGLVLLLSERVARKPLAKWFWADSRMQLSGLSLALMALLLALGVNVGVGTMVQSFSKTFTGWLDGRLAAEVYLNAASDAQAVEIKAWLRDRPEVQAVLPGSRAEAQLGGWPIDLIGFADHATYREQWPLLESSPGAWDLVARGEAALISEQLALRLKLKLGDRVAVPTPQGSWPLEVVAIYADYGNPRGQLGVAIAALVAHFPGIAQTRFGLRVTPAAVPALVTALREKFALDNRSLADQAALKAESRKIFNRTFAVTNALNAFTLGIAGVALLTSLLTLSQSRLPQLAPLWAIGITRRKLAVIELMKTLSVALITALLALPLGLVVAWCLIAVVNVKAFGWRLPFQVFPEQLVQLVGIAMLASLLAALLPILNLLRMQPAQLVKVFADER